MSTITINIDAETSAAIATTTTTPESGDGGSPKFSDSETSTASQIDIGGPPTWLNDAIGGNKTSEENQTAVSSATGSDAGDGGSAKVALN